MPAKRPGLSARQHDLLLQGVESLGINLPVEALGAIEIHLSLVQKWRTRMNLVSIRNERELITHHALDSLTVLPCIEQSRWVLDIGSGAGFPGMLLAAAKPAAHFSLLDSRRRRIEFLRMANTHVGLNNVDFICARVEELSRASKGGLEKQPALHESDVHAPTKFDTLVARAVASLEQLVEMTLPLRYAGQRLIAMKGQYPRKELDVLTDRYADQIESVSVTALDVPFLQAERHVVQIVYK